jgi:hypothetical protein
MMNRKDRRVAQLLGRWHDELDEETENVLKNMKTKGKEEASN